jgi:hypothetical protein
MMMARTRQIMRNWTHFREILKQPGFPENPAHQSPRSRQIVVRDVVRDLFKVLERGEPASPMSLAQKTYFPAPEPALR